MKEPGPAPAGSGGLVRALVLATRFLQAVLGLTVCGLYGVDLDAARRAHAYTDSKWVYAEVVAGLSVLTALLLAVPQPVVKAWALWAWDAVLALLWLVLFGVFGTMYIHEHPEGDAGVTRMKHAVWVDLVNALLWIATAAYGAVLFAMFRRGRSLHTGRSVV